MVFAIDYDGTFSRDPSAFRDLVEVLRSTLMADAIPEWDGWLKDFCTEHGIDWPEDGAGWHLTVERS